MFCVCMLVFFFKQKTAYEMRISDWSSDVCSSDLYYEQDCATGRFSLLGRLWDQPSLRRALWENPSVRLCVLPTEFNALRNWGTSMWGKARLVHGDRKSVVSGKRVSVRVGLGGRRNIKKKKHK